MLKSSCSSWGEVDFQNQCSTSAHRLYASLFFSVLQRSQDGDKYMWSLWEPTARHSSWGIFLLLSNKG